MLVTRSYPCRRFRSAPLIREGRPFPRRATWDEIAVNFVLRSVNATKVELCLFGIDGKQEIERNAPSPSDS
jgi:glycogen operon protein